MATAINLMQPWLDEAVALRADMLKSEVKFFNFLIEGERGACPWRGQYTDFEQFLETTNLCSTQRYTSFRDALGQVDNSVRKEIETLGVDGIIEAGRIDVGPKRVEFAARVVEGTKSQGCPLSPRRIKQIGEEIQPKKRPKRRPHGKSYEQLLKENKTLKVEVARLKAENATLKDQLRPRKK